MRLSTGMIYDQQTRGISNAQQSWLQSGEQLSTGKRVVRPSDDPVAAAQAVVLSQSMAEKAQFSNARGFAVQSISTEENILGQSVTAIQSAQSTLVSVVNGSLSDDDRAAYATELEGVRDQLFNLANSTDGNGRYLFGGYNSDKPPFTKDNNGNITYTGGDTPITQKVDDNRTMVTSHTGDQIFNALTSNAEPEPNGGQSETNLFAMLNSAITALQTPTEGADEKTVAALAAVVSKSSRGLSNSLDNVSSVRSVLGTQLKELDALNTQGSDISLIQKTQMSGLVDVDYTSAISSYIMQQAALNASYTVFSQMSKMSLFSMNA